MADQEAPFYVVTVAEAWRILDRQAIDIAQIKADIALISERQAADIAQGVDREKRLRKLEFRYFAIIAALLTALVTQAFVLGRGILG